MQLKYYIYAVIKNILYRKRIEIDENNNERGIIKDWCVSDKNLFSNWMKITLAGHNSCLQFGIGESIFENQVLFQINHFNGLGMV